MSIRERIIMSIRERINKIREKRNIKKIKLAKEALEKKYKDQYGETRTYGESKKLGFLLVYLEEVGVKEIKEGVHDCTVIFNDDSYVNFWNSNRWYSWMYSGTAKFSNGKEYKWSHAQPSYKILNKYKTLILTGSEPTVDPNDYTEFLPLRLQRKYKLNKLDDINDDGK